MSASESARGGRVTKRSADREPPVICTHLSSPQLVDCPRGLTVAATRVLQSACDEAVRTGTFRLSSRQVAARLGWMAQADHVVERSIDALVSGGYLVADDQPDLPDTMLHLTRMGFESYATRYVNRYLELSSRVLCWLAERGEGHNARDAAHACGVSEFLAAHILEMAASSALIDLQRRPHYVVVSAVSPVLRRIVRGVVSR